MFVHMCLCIVYIFQAEDSERIRRVSPVVWVRTRSSETNSGLLRHKKRVNSSFFGHVMRPVAYVIHKLVITHRKSWNKAALRTHVWVHLPPNTGRTDLHMQRGSHSQWHTQTQSKTHVRTGLISYMVEPQASWVLYSVVLIGEQTFTYQSRQFLPVMF